MLSISRKLWFAFCCVLLTSSTALARDSISVGLSVPLTGSFADSGKYIRDGAIVAQAEINSTGGVLAEESRTSDK